jgi:hypothetical protein
MYLWMSSFRAMPGKEEQAVAWAKDAAALINRGCALAAPCQVLSEVFGEHATNFFSLGINSLADADQIFAWSGQDQAFRALANGRDEAGLVVPGSRRDTLLRHR